jgi:uncharacterized protein (TIGR02217 family)
MSNLVFPTLAGQDIAIKRTPVFSTVVQTAASGKELRASYQGAPRWRYEIPLKFARITGFSTNTITNEMAAILGLFNAVKGKWDSFLYTDPYSNTAANTPFGTGNGSTTAFQLLDIEGFPIYDLNGSASVYVSGVLTTPASIVNGLVTFNTAPANGAALTWSGVYYRRVRFDMDEYEQEQMLNLCWNGGTIKLISVK